MKLNSLIIDDFLDDPDYIRNFLINNKVPFESSVYSYHRGKRTMPVDNIDYQNIIIEKLNQVLPFKFKMRIDLNSYCFHLCLSSSGGGFVHLDLSTWTGILYLTPNAPLDKGTLLYKEGADPTSDPTCLIGNVYNRLVLLRGKEVPHTANLPGFGDCLENGRLTQVFFFDEV